MSASFNRAGKAALLCSAVVFMTPPLAVAQQVVGAPSYGGHADDNLNLLSPKLMSLRPLKRKPTREYHGLPVGSWMLYPSLLVGATYDDNVFQSSLRRVSSGGLHLRPSIYAERDVGIHKTKAYFDGDFRLYPDYPAANIVNLATGISHTWEARRDLVFNSGFEFRRHTDMYNTGMVRTPFGFGFQASPQRYTQYTGNVAGFKSFNRFFVGLGGVVTGTTYDTLYTSFGPLGQGYRDNIASGVIGRVGYAVSPLIYAFAEGAGNFRSFSSWYYNSQGYRVVGGVGTDRIGLMRGEIFGGYQRQFYTLGLFNSPSMPVVGGRLFWYPTRDLTLTAAVDQSFQDNGLITIGNATGSAARVISARGTADYRVSRDITFRAFGGFDDLRYVAGTRHDNRWLAGASLNYEIFRNLSATFEYNFATVASNAFGASFTRNTFTLGGTYKY